MLILLDDKPPSFRQAHSLKQSKGHSVLDKHLLLKKTSFLTTRTSSVFKCQCGKPVPFDTISSLEQAPCEISPNTFAFHWYTKEPGTRCTWTWIHMWHHRITLFHSVCSRHRTCFHFSLRFLRFVRVRVPPCFPPPSASVCYARADWRAFDVHVAGGRVSGVHRGLMPEVVVLALLGE